jgi:hypothetical protein
VGDSKLPRITYDEDEEPSHDGAPPPSQFECADCHTRSPPTRTGETLVTSKHGWRATRIATADGGVAAEWRCPAGWTAFPAKKLSTF